MNNLESMTIYQQCQYLAEESFKYSDYESQLFDRLCYLLQNPFETDEFEVIKINSFIESLKDEGDNLKATVVEKALKEIKERGNYDV